MTGADSGRSLPRLLAVLGVAFLLISSVLLGYVARAAAWLGTTGTLVALAAVVLVLIVLGRRSGTASAHEPADGPGDGPEESDADSADGAGHSVWNVIPSWQYGGRHVESGGLTRDEQERAIREIQTQAEEIERLDVDDPDH